MGRHLFALTLVGALWALIVLHIFLLILITLTLWHLIFAVLLGLVKTSGAEAVSRSFLSPYTKLVSYSGSNRVTRLHLPSGWSKKSP